jgi:hypothetical protein
MDGFTKTLTGFLHDGVEGLGQRIHGELARLGGDDAGNVKGDSGLLTAVSVVGSVGAQHATPLRRVGSLRDLCAALRAADVRAAATGEAQEDSSQRRLQLTRACAQLRRTGHSSDGSAAAPAPPPPTSTHLEPLSCGSLSAFPAFAAAARRHEAALRRGRPAGAGAPDGAAGCVLAALDVVAWARRQASRGGLLTDDVVVVSALERVLSPHLPLPAGGGISAAAAAGGEPAHPPLRERLTAGGFFRHAAKWRTHSTTYAAVVVEQQEAAASGSYRSGGGAPVFTGGHGGAAGGGGSHGSLPPLVHDGSKSWEPGQWGDLPTPSEAAALAALDGLSLLGFLANAPGTEDERWRER